MAFASTHTLLPLDRWAHLIQVNPVYFSGAYGQDFFTVANRKQQALWFQYAWQWADGVSREELAIQIAGAEADVAAYLGYLPAPWWTEQEVRRFPRHHRPDAWRYGMRDARGQSVAVKAKHGKIISAGVRALSDPITPVTLAYSDADGDGWSETATVSVATTVTDVCEIKVYFAGHSGDPEWEIRPARTKALSGGTATLTFWRWQMILPNLLTFFPTIDSARGVDLDQAANLLTDSDIEVRREYNDPTQTTMTAYWQPNPPLLNGFCSSCGGVGCVVCQLTTQDGCIHIADAETGLVVPEIASYDATDAEWDAQCPSNCRDPDMVKIYYYSGNLPQPNLAGRNCDQMDQDIALAISWIAAARLERTLCSGANVTGLAQDLREDLAISGRTGHQLTESDLSNPFGTRRGEIMAWRKIGNLTEAVFGGVVI